MKPHVTKKLAYTLALTLLTCAVAAAPASATGRHHHPNRNTARTKRLAKAQPTQIPILDGDLNRIDIDLQFAMQQVSAPIAQTYSRGGGIKVAILDGGFDLGHEALMGHIAPGEYDALDGGFDAQDLGDGIDNDLDGTTDWIVGHGTFVASIVLSIAPDAMVLPIRVLDDEGWGTDATVTSGIYYAIGQGVKVINMSLVVPMASPMLRQALDAAADAGIVVVGAAGNEPGQWYDDPNLAHRVLSVGAVNSMDMLLPWSVTGSEVDIYAPGENVVGALGGAIPNSYARWSGTSFAAPFTAAGAALLKAHEPFMTAHDVVYRIKHTDDPALLVVPITRGRIDLGHALQGL